MNSETTSHRACTRICSHFFLKLARLFALNAYQLLKFRHRPQKFALCHIAVTDSHDEIIIREFVHLRWDSVRDILARSHDNAFRQMDGLA